MNTAPQPSTPPIPPRPLPLRPPVLLRERVDDAVVAQFIRDLATATR